MFALVAELLADALNGNFMINILYLSIVLGFIILYTGLLILGFKKLENVLKSDKFNLKNFLISQILIGGGLVGLMVAYDLVIGKVIAPLETINYFELGSFSLIITSLTLIDSNKLLSRQLRVLSSFSSLIIFLVGFTSFFSRTFLTTGQWLIYIQNGGVILGIANLIYSSILLFNFFNRE